MAKAIYCLLPASTSVESKFYEGTLIQPKRRNSFNPKQFENLAVMKCNKNFIAFHNKKILNY